MPKPRRNNYPAQPGYRFHHIPPSDISRGINTYNPSTEVIWADGRNIRFKPGMAYKKLGQTLITQLPNQAPPRAIYTFRGFDNTLRTIVCTDTKIYSYTNNFATVQDITPVAPPTSGELDVWQFALIGQLPDMSQQILIISNGKDPMWQWTNYAGALTLVTGTPPTQARAITTASNVLMLGDILEGGTHSPARVRWSDIGNPNYWTIDGNGGSDLQDVWNPNRSAFGNNREQIMAFSNSQSRIKVYTDFNIYYSEPVEHPHRFTFHLAHERDGLIAPRAIATVNDIDYYLGRETFFRYGADGVREIGEAIKNSCHPNINKAALNTAFAFYKWETKEVVFCIALGTATSPSHAFVYNTLLDAWSIDDDINYSCQTYSYDESNYSWSTLPYGSWDTITDSRWELLSKNGIINYSIVGGTDGKLYKLDVGNNNNTAAINAWIESADFSLGNNTLQKIIHEIYPTFKPQTNTNSVMIQVGVRDSLSQPIRWSYPFNYVLGSSDRADFREMGKYARIRFMAQTLDSPFILSEYNIKFNMAGNR